MPNFNDWRIFLKFVRDLLNGYARIRWGQMTDERLNGRQDAYTPSLPLADGYFESWSVDPFCKQMSVSGRSLSTHVSIIDSRHTRARAGAASYAITRDAARSERDREHTRATID